MSAWLVDGELGAAVPVDDRGLRYGDGVFETTWWRGGEAPLWPWHRARLRRGLARLGIAAPDDTVLQAEARTLLGATGSGVIRIVVTRGSGARGYAPPPMATPRRIVSLESPPAPVRGGLRLRWCRTRIARQPLLAGLKHLNRLEQVLARAECDPATDDEGLMEDDEGNVVSATAANLFAVVDGVWVTPALVHGGVAGACRAALLDAAPPRPIVERTLTRAEIERADELFLTNALRGAVSVVRLGERSLEPGPFQSWARAQLAALGFDPSRSAPA